MNLSALHSGLPQAPINPLTEAQPSANALPRVPAGTLSGEDFAAFLRNQVNALKSMQRQEVAASKAANLSTAKPEAPPSKVQGAPAEPARSETARAEPSNDRQLDHADAKRAADLHADQQNDQRNLADQAQANNAKAVNAEPASENQALPTETQDSSVAATDTANPLPASSQTANASTDTWRADADPTLTNTSSAELTTIPLGPHINIITATQALPDDKSVADFALAMGLAPDQVQALFGNTAVTANTGAATVSTQQMLGIQGLASVSVPALLPEQTGQLTVNALDALVSDVAVSSADFQALKAQSPAPDANLNPSIQTLDILNFQASTGPVTANVMPVSTLAVLSMMDTELRAEDIDALKNEFDSLTSLDGSSPSEYGFGLRSTESSHAAHAASKAAAALAAQPNMAATYDKLSQKLATELAGRMHDQLNAGEWKMKFALKPASLGLVDVQLEMRDGQLTAQFNADTSLTQDLIQSGSQRLKEALGQLGMNNASVLVGQGQNQHPGSSSSSHQPAERTDNRVTLSDAATEEPAGQVRPRHSNSLQFDNYA